MQKRHNNKQLYFDELAHTTRKYTLTYIESVCKINRDAKILEIGCGIGGNLLPLVERGYEVTGVDINPSTIEKAQEIFAERGYSNISLIAANIFSVEDLGGTFDLIIARDVIEHITDKEAFVLHLKRFLKPDGMIYISFPAWQMPFGGHQQICRHKIPACLPFAHLLPMGLYKGYLKVFGEREDIVNELVDIKCCGLSIGKFLNVISKCGLEIVASRPYLINPHYEVKFGLAPKTLWTWVYHTPFIRNFCTTSCTYILRCNRNRV